MTRSLLALAALLMFSATPALAEGGAGGGKRDGAVRAACEADIKSLCGGIEPGGGRIKACMKEKRDQLSEGCKAALKAAKGRRGGGKGGPGGGTTEPTEP